MCSTGSTYVMHPGDFQRERLRWGRQKSPGSRLGTLWHFKAFVRSEPEQPIHIRDGRAVAQRAQACGRLIVASSSWGVRDAGGVLPPPVAPRQS